MKPKTYRCQNKDCAHFKQKKYAKTLFKGHIEGDSFVIIRCNFCNTDRAVNVTKEEPPKKVDTKQVKLEDIAKLLGRNAS